MPKLLKPETQSFYTILAAGYRRYSSQAKKQQRLCIVKVYSLRCYSSIFYTYSFFRSPVIVSGSKHLTLSQIVSNWWSFSRSSFQSFVVCLILLVEEGWGSQCGLKRPIIRKTTKIIQTWVDWHQILNRVAHNLMWGTRWTDPNSGFLNAVVVNDAQF